MTASSSGGTEGLIDRGEAGFELITACSVITTFVPVNGFFPVAISNSITPKENMSLRTSRSSDRACSGDIYTAVPGITPTCVSDSSSEESVVVPTLPSLASFAKPKSRIFTCPFGVRKIFAGLMSRCTIPLACDAANASATCTAMSSRSSRSIGRPWIRCFRLSPSSFSMTINGCPLLSSMSWIVQMFG